MRRVLAVWLMLFALVSGCRNTSEEPAPPPAPAAPKVEVAAVSPPPAPLLSDCGRVETEGYVFGLAADTLGNVVASTRRGRKALYLMSADAEEHAAPAALELDDHPSALASVGRGAFAVGVGEEVLLVAATRRDGQPALEVLWQVEVGGRPASFAAYGQLIWVAVRGTPTGQGLLGIAADTGAIVHRLESGDTPIELVVSQDLWMLTMRGDEGGRVSRIRLERGIPEVVHGDLPGIPLRLVDPGFGEHVYVLLHSVSGVQPLARTSLTPTGLLDLDFVPQNMVTDRDARALFLLTGSGTLARLDMSTFGGGGGTPPELRRQVSLRTSEMAIVSEANELVILDASARTIALLGGATLDERATLQLDGVMGRLIFDRERRRGFVSLPERGEVQCFSLERP